MTDVISRVPQSVTAIALDANAAPKGVLRIADIEKLIEVLDDQELNVEVWVPEPVLWEWAEHLHAAASKAQLDYRKASKSAVESELPGFETGPDYKLDVVEVLALLGERLNELSREDGGEAVKTLQFAPSGSEAIYAPRDQILQTGSGRRKSNGRSTVQTGAADSASWRLVESASADLSKVVLVSADSDVDRHFDASSSPIILKSLWHARTELLKLSAGSEAASNAIEDAIHADLPGLPAEVLASVDLEKESLLFEMNHDMTFDPRVTLTRVVRVVDFIEIEMSRSDEIATALAEVEADFAIEYVRWDDRTESVESDLEQEYGIRAIAHVSAESYTDAQLEWGAWIDSIEVLDARS